MRLVSRVSFGEWVSPETLDEIRWYVEKYPKETDEGAKRRAEKVSAAARRLGVSLFRGLFGGETVAGELWACVRNRLDRLRIEVMPTSPRGQAVPWELMRAPESPSPLALASRSFVRGTSWAPTTPEWPQRASPLKILFVVSRLEGDFDVAPDNIAEPLAQVLAEDADSRFHIDHLETATLEALEARLHGAAQSGQPYHIVHFDGHGQFQQVSASNEASTETKGYLLLESPDSYDAALVDGKTLGELLERFQVPWLVLNACESSRTTVPNPRRYLSEIFSIDGKELEPDIASHAFDREVMKQGLIGVVSMLYEIDKSAAREFFKGFYKALVHGASIGEAAAAGRRALQATQDRTQSSPYDWSIPVVYESRPFSLFSSREEWFQYARTLKSSL
jgi:hypothetical protein